MFAGKHEGPECRAFVLQNEIAMVQPADNPASAAFNVALGRIAADSFAMSGW